MEKLIALLRRAPGMEREEFFRRYREEHAPLVLQHRRGVMRYTFDLVDLPPEEVGLRAGGGQPAYDAVSELWLETLEHYTDPDRGWTSPEGRDAVVRHSAALLSERHVYRVREFVEKERERDWPDGVRSPGVKSIYLAQRREGMSSEEYAAYWGDRHAPLALKRHIGMWRYVRNVVIEPLSPDAPAWDGFAELHFRTTADLRERMYDSEEGRAAIAADVAKFTAGGRALHTSEYIVKS